MNEIMQKSRDVESVAPPKPRGWGTTLLGAGTVLLLVGGLAFGTWRYATQRDQTLADSKQRQEFVPSVRVATIEPVKNDVVASLPATITAYETANVYARASGYIETRKADIGDHVKSGDLLAEITAPELDHQITRAKATLNQTTAALNQAQANLELARVTWARDRPLVESGWTTAQQGTIDVQNLKALEAGVHVAQSNLEAQQAQIKVLDQEKSYQRVVAPFEGVITQRNIDTGSLVQADATTGTFLYTIMQSHIVRTQLYVPQDQAFGLAPGVDAVIRVPEIPDRTFPGKVTRIADALQPGTRTLLTEIDVPNPDNLLSPGIYCTVDLHLPRTSAALIVPAGAIIFNRDGMQTAVVENGVAKIRKISVGRDFGKEVEVRAGVTPGEQVILNPPVDLVDGSKVQIRPEPTPAAKRGLARAGE